MDLLRTKKTYQFANTYLQDQIFCEGSEEVKLGYLNINSLLNKTEDVDQDKNLRNCDILVLSETRLSKEAKVEFENFHISRYDFEDKKTKTPHLGLALLTKKTNKLQLRSKASFLKLSGNTIFQYLELHVKSLGIQGIMFYINRKPNKGDTQMIVKHFKKRKLDFFIGDLNLNFTQEEDKKRILNITNGLKLKSILHQSTRNKSHLDHVMIEENCKFATYASSFINLYTDHSAVTLRVSKDGKFTSEFMEDQIKKQELNYLIHKNPVIKEKTLTTGSISADKKERTETDIIMEDNIIMKEKNFILYEKELERLNPPQFLSDEIINAYLYLISKKYSNVFIFDTYFHTTLEENGFNEKRNYANRNPFDHISWLLPINFQNSHWILLHINVQSLNNSQVEITLYDSATEAGFAYNINTKEILKYVRYMYKKYKNLELQNLNVLFKNISDQIPQQENSFDCGTFVLGYAICLAAKETIIFSQSMIDSFRRNLKHEFRRGALSSICPLFISDKTHSKTKHTNNKGKKRAAAKSFKQSAAKRMENEDACTQSISKDDANSKKPTGLINLGNTCYFNALMQCLKSLPSFENAIHLDKHNIRDSSSLACKMAQLFDGLDEKKSFEDLRKLKLEVLEIIRRRIDGEYQPGYQADPQELYIHIKMILNENQRRQDQITTLRNFPNLHETIENYQNNNPSNTTKQTTIYTKVTRYMHERKSCITETFQRLSTLVLPFEQSEKIQELTTVEALIANCLNEETAEKVKCPLCSLTNVNVSIETLLVHLPDILILTAER